MNIATIDNRTISDAPSPQNLPATLDRIETALAQASTPDEINRVLALMDAAVAYAKRFYKDQQDVIQRAKALRFQAERRLGEMLRVMPKNVGSKSQLSGDVVGGSKVVPPTTDNTPTLASIGIDKKTSARAQQLAAMPNDKFEMVARGMISVSQATTPRKKSRPMTGPKAESIREELAAAKSRGTSMLSMYARLILELINNQPDFSTEERDLLNQIECAIQKLKEKE